MELEFVSFHAGLTQADANGKMLVSGAEVVARTRPAHAQCCTFKTPNRRFKEELKHLKAFEEHILNTNTQETCTPPYITVLYYVHVLPVCTCMLSVYSGQCSFSVVWLLLLDA